MEYDLRAMLAEFRRLNGIGNLNRANEQLAATLEAMLLRIEELEDLGDDFSDEDLIALDSTAPKECCGKCTGNREDYPLLNADGGPLQFGPGLTGYGNEKPDFTETEVAAVLENLETQRAEAPGQPVEPEPKPVFIEAKPERVPPRSAAAGERTPPPGKPFGKPAGKRVK